MINSFEARDFLVRNTYCSYKNEEFISYQQLVENCLSDQVFLEQLALANPKLFETLKRYSFGNLKKKREKSLFSSIFKYYKRSFQRSTPFGLFSETSIGKFAEEGQSSLSSNTIKCVSLDSQWLIELVYKLENEFYESLSFSINGSNFESGDRIFQLYTVNNTDLEEINIKLTNVYKIIEEACRDKFCSYSVILDKILKEYGLEYRSLAEQYILGLIKNHYLLSNLQKDLVSRFNQENFIRILQNIDYEDKYTSSFKQIVSLINEYKTLKIGKGTNLLLHIYQKMSSLVENENYLQVDLLSDSKVKLNVQHKKELERFANFIGNTQKSVRRSYLDDYRDKFIEKYGVDQEVPLLELLDPTFGIGAPYGYVHPKSNFYENEPLTEFYSTQEQSKYLSEYIHSIRENVDIDLEKFEDYYQLEENNKFNLQGLELFFNIVENNGKPAFSLSNIVGGSDIGSASGRFSILSDELRKYQKSLLDFIEEEDSTKKITSCEIEFIPENLRHRNIMRTMNVRDKTLSLFTNNSKKQIHLKDIYIGINNEEKFYAKDITNNDIVKFHVTNMYNKMLFCNEIRFLYEISLDIDSINLPWELIYSDFDYVPRIMFGDIIVAPARWKICEGDIERLSDINTFFINKRIPQKFYLINGDNRILLSRKDKLDVEFIKNELIKKLKKDSIVELQEYIQDFGIFTKEATDRVADVVIPFVNNVKKDIDITAHAKRIGIESREKLPFDEWLYLKLYIGDNRQNEFIKEYLPNIQEVVDSYQGELFYLRYADPNSHIRLRMKCDNLFDLYKQILNIISEGRKNRLISSVDISTYDREIERYGGEDLLLEAEKIFCTDSRLMPRLLKICETNEMGFNLDSLSIVSVYLYLVFFFDNDLHEIISFLETVSPKRNDKNKDINSDVKEYQKIIEANCNEKFFLCLKNPIKSLNNKMLLNKLTKQQHYSIIDSIIHVHNNRLIGIDREKEKYIYFVLRRIFISKTHIK